MRRLVPLALFLGALVLRALFWREVVGSGEIPALLTLSTIVGRF